MPLNLRDSGLEETLACMCLFSLVKIRFKGFRWTDLFCMNRGFIFLYHSLVSCAGKPYIVDRGHCTRSPKVTLFSYVHFKTGLLSMIFNMVLFKVGRNECIWSNIFWVCFCQISKKAYFHHIPNKWKYFPSFSWCHFSAECKAGSLQVLLTRDLYTV